MKLAIVGSRGFKDYAKLADIIFKFFIVDYKKLEIISGGAKGTDSLARDFAENHGLNYTEYSADWEKHGKQAGFLRNQQIVDSCDAVIAFWDSQSKGTKDTLNKAKIAHKITITVYI